MNATNWRPLLAMAIVSASATLVAQVKTDHDRNIDFSRYATYSWEAVHAENPLFVDRIRSAVNAALAAKGWTKVKSGGDVSIMAMEMSKDHRTLRTYYSSFGGGWTGVGAEG